MAKSEERIPICIIADVPEIKALDDELQALMERTDTELTFIKKQAENLANRANKEKDEIWKRVEAWLIENGRMPAFYSPKTHALSFEDGVLSTFRCKSDEEEMLKQLQESGMPKEIAKYAAAKIKQMMKDDK